MMGPATPLNNKPTDFVALSESYVGKPMFDLFKGEQLTFTTLSEAMEYVAYKYPEIYEAYRRNALSQGR